MKYGDKNEKWGQASFFVKGRVFSRKHRKEPSVPERSDKYSWSASLVLMLSTHWNNNNYFKSLFGPVLMCVEYRVKPVNARPPTRLPSTVGNSFQMK